ncbi:uncharacterized protein LOC134826671 isoform X2 [Bolinopsis microptera]|uniref:uncharacterized protein LOC134826671 isoform X2 n=1 Tax=Bolinopsis microptera TaxID=2820187 RepID=UPI0030791C60
MTITIIILTILLWSSVKGELPVKRDVEIEWDLESTPLEIRTDSELGSDDQVQVRFYSAVGAYAGGIMLLFSSTPQYSLGYCTSSYKNFAVNPPSAADKVWRITLTRTAGVRLVIHCNEVEVLNILLSQTCALDIWSSKWSDDVAKIKFDLSDDTASDYYGTQLQLPEDTSEEDDENEQGDNQNYSDAAALKVSLIFLVVLLFAVNMSI